MDRNIDFIQLANSISRLEKLIPHLIANGVYSERILRSKISSFMAPATQTLSIVLDLKTKGPKVLQKFYQCLVDAEEYNAAKNMNPNFQIPEKKIISLNNSTIKNSIQILESKRQDTKVIQAQVEDLGIVVKPAEELMDDDTHKTPIYRMKSNPKGYALVIVNLQFSCSSYRVGADKDHAMLIAVFSGLGYKVQHHLNKTCMEMEKIVAEFATGLDHSAVDSCIVAVSTHGDKDCLLGSDSEGLPREEIITQFNNSRCPDLMDKPKLFFFQACRGDYYDSGVKLQDSTDGTSISRKKALFTDMWIFSSTIPEYVSWRNAKGSWFVVAVAEVFSKHAWNTPISKLYIMVDELMEDLEARNCERSKQVPELTIRSIRKDLYFNPGKYAPLVQQIKPSSS